MGLYGTLEQNGLHLNKIAEVGLMAVVIYDTRDYTHKNEF